MEVYTAAELAKRWKCSIQTIYDMEERNTLQRIVKLPGHRYRARDIEAIEGLSDEEKAEFAPYERLKLKNENKKLKNENEMLKTQIEKIRLLLMGVEM